MDSHNNTESNIPNRSRAASTASLASDASPEPEHPPTPSDSATQLYGGDAAGGAAGDPATDFDFDDDKDLGAAMEFGVPAVETPVVLPLVVRQAMRAVAHIVDPESGQNVTNVVANPTFVVNVGNRGAVTVRKEKKVSQSIETTERNDRKAEHKKARGLFMHSAKVKKDEERDVAEKIVKDKNKTNNLSVLRLKTQHAEAIATQTKLFVSATDDLLAKIQDQNLADKKIAAAILLSQVEDANRDLSAFDAVFTLRERAIAADLASKEDDDSAVSEMAATPQRRAVVNRQQMTKRSKTFAPGFGERLKTMIGKLPAIDAAIVLKDVAFTVAAVEADICSPTTKKPRASGKSCNMKQPKTPDTPEVAEKKRKRNLRDADRRLKKKLDAQLPSDFEPADLSSFQKKGKKPRKNKALVQSSDSDSEVVVVERHTTGGKGVMPRIVPVPQVEASVDAPVSASESASESSSSGEE